MTLAVISVYIGNFDICIEILDKPLTNLWNVNISQVAQSSQTLLNCMYFMLKCRIYLEARKYAVAVVIVWYRWINSYLQKYMQPVQAYHHQGRIQGGSAPLKLEKIWFFGVKSWFFTRNTPTIFAPPSAIGKNMIFLA